MWDAQTIALINRISAQNVRLREAIVRIIEAYEWCSHDPVDRGWSALSHQVRICRSELERCAASGDSVTLPNSTIEGTATRL